MKLDNVLGLHAQALQLHSRRAEVLASNIANADTPGYKARDFNFREVLKNEMAEPGRMATTNSKHIQTEQGLVPSSQLNYRVPTQPSLDGNTVDTQLEHTAYAENALEYQASLRFLSGTINTLKKAITGQ